MTYEEAIELLRTEYIVAHGLSIVPKEVAKLAIEALQKQVPVKPKHYDSVPHARCPKCNNSVKVYCDAHEYHYCLFCGQRILWEDEE